IATTAVWLLFFFQAEDGIRDRNVTGVQTCALPISSTMMVFARRHSANSARVRSSCADFSDKANVAISAGEGSLTSIGSSGFGSRSEERRVGKECRSQWGQHQ